MSCPPSLKESYLFFWKASCPFFLTLEKMKSVFLFFYFTTIVSIEVCQWLLVWKKWGWPRLGKCWIPRNPILKLTSSFKISKYILHISPIYQISMNLDMKFKKIYPSIFENSDILPLFHRSFQPIFHLYFWMFYQ